MAMRISLVSRASALTTRYTIMNYHKTSIAVLTLTLLLLGAAGCGEPKPEGMPDLHKVKIILTQEGKPCDDAKIGLLPLGGDPQWSSGGTTDSNGNLEPVTHGKYKGMPVGKYRVTVDKSVGEGEPPPPSPIDAESKKKFDDYVASGKTYKLFQVIPNKYRLRDSSPLDIEVKEGANEFTLDIPEAVKNEVKSSGFR